MATNMETPGAGTPGDPIKNAVLKLIDADTRLGQANQQVRKASFQLDTARVDFRQLSPSRREFRRQTDKRDQKLRRRITTFVKRFNHRFLKTVQRL